MKKILSLILFVIMAMPSIAQAPKGSFYFYWGYNRSAFSASDIRFTGDGYDFRLNNVKASDRPTKFDAETYFNPTSMWIPQYVYRLGYHITEQWSISLGVDHMKYIVHQNQSVTVDGFINVPNNPFNGNYNGQVALVDTNLLYFEHTDGLNYLSINADRQFLLYKNANSTIEFSLIAGGGLGAVIPKSNVQLFKGEPSDRFHLAGYGLNGNVGLNVLIWKHFFIRSQAKGGFMHLPDVLTVPGDAIDRANHNFWFIMGDIAVGGQWHF